VPISQWSGILKPADTRSREPSVLSREGSRLLIALALFRFESALICFLWSVFGRYSRIGLGKLGAADALPEVRI